MEDIAAAALQVQIKALIDGWQRDAAGAKRIAEADFDDYQQGWADALDRCVQALKMLTDAP